MSGPPDPGERTALAEARARMDEEARTGSERARIRRLLAMRPAERLQSLVEEVRGIQALVRAAGRE